MRRFIGQIARASPAVDRTARQLLAIIPRSRRLGPNFAYWYALFEESENWSRQQIDAMRMELLTGLITTIKAQNPYYQRLFDGVPVDAVVRDLPAHVPVMTREDFRHSFSELSAPGPRKGLSGASTSGSTGSALQFFNTYADDSREWAGIFHQWRRIGYDPFRDLRAEVRGLVTTRDIVQRFPEHNMVRFSVVHLRAPHIRRYAEVCQADGVKFVHGYPSALYVMARVMIEEGVRIPGIRGVMLASEMVYPHQVAAVEEAFPDAKVIAHYGNAERVALSAWCEHTRDYHFLPLYGQVEVQPDGLLIGTNYFNTINPFVRYDTGDIVQSEGEQTCAKCGRLSLPLAIDIDGRAGDYLYSPERGWIAPAIMTYPLHALRSIHEIQFAQDTPDRIELRYTAFDGADCTEELEGLLEKLKVVLGEARVEPVRYDHFERGPTGKLRWIQSSLSPETL